MCLCAAVATVTNRDGHGWFRVFKAPGRNI